MCILFASADFCKYFTVKANKYLAKCYLKVVQYDFGFREMAKQHIIIHVML